MSDRDVTAGGEDMGYIVWKRVELMDEKDEKDGPQVCRTRRQSTT